VSYGFQFRRRQIMPDKPMKIPGPDHPTSRVVVTVVGGKAIIILTGSSAATYAAVSSRPPAVTEQFSLF
jgi:hypothetical protein